MTFLKILKTQNDPKNTQKPKIQITSKSHVRSPQMKKVKKTNNNQN